MNRVLVPMSRSEAEWYDALGEGTGHGPTHRPLRAALDTDREQQVERVARAIEGFAADGIDIGWDRCGSARKELARLAASRVLSALEQEGDTDA